MRIATFITLLSAAALAAPEADRTAWQWQHSFAVENPGLVRLDLPPPTLGASQPSLADLRLVSPDGIETPYLIDEPKPTRRVEAKARGFKASIVDRTTVLEAATGTMEPIEALR